jgi:hypothetical protein
MWIEPLEMETWIINIFSGDIAIFTGIALFVITALASYFRMTGITLMLMIGVFFIIFQGYVDQSIYFLLIAITGLLVGYWGSQLVKR